MIVHPPCLEWRERLALRREDLTSTDQQALDVHVETCASCARAQADYHFFEARLDALPPPTIKPLPRLSPHFFEAAEQGLADYNEPADRKSQKSNLVKSRKNGSARKKTPLVWQVLSAAVVATLILASGLLFRQLSLSNQAAHPLNGDTWCNLNQHTDAVTAVVWSPNGAYIATASQDHTVRVWNAQNCQLLNTYWGHSGPVEALAWSHDSQLLASASYDGTVQLWNALSSNTNPLITYGQYQFPILAVAWSPDDQKIASGGNDDTLHIWNAHTGAPLWSYTDQGVSQTEPIDAVAWSPDGNQIATGSWNNLVQVFNAQKGTLTSSFDGHLGHVNAVAWSPNSQYLASASSDGTVQVWKTDPLEGNQVVQRYTKHSGPVYAVAWSPDGQYIASGGSDNTVRVWNAFTGITIKVYRDQTSSINSVGWQPGSVGMKSDEIVSGSADHTARVWLVSGLS